METRENRWIRLKFIDQLMEAIMQRLGLIESRIPTEEEMAALQLEEGMLPTLIDAQGRILTDNTEAIILG